MAMGMGAPLKAMKIEAEGGWIMMSAPTPCVRLADSVSSPVVRPTTMITSITSTATANTVMMRAQSAGASRSARSCARSRFGLRGIVSHVDHFHSRRLLQHEAIVGDIFIECHFRDSNLKCVVILRSCQNDAGARTSLYPMHPTARIACPKLLSRRRHML